MQKIEAGRLLPCELRLAIIGHGLLDLLIEAVRVGGVRLFHPEPSGLVANDHDRRVGLAVLDVLTKLAFNPGEVLSRAGEEVPAWPGVATLRVPSELVQVVGGGVDGQGEEDDVLAEAVAQALLELDEA